MLLFSLSSIHVPLIYVDFLQSIFTLLPWRGRIRRKILKLDLSWWTLAESADTPRHVDRTFEHRIVPYTQHPFLGRQNLHWRRRPSLLAMSTSTAYPIPSDLSPTTVKNTASLLRIVALALISGAAIASRLFAVINFESIIHELYVHLSLMFVEVSSDDFRCSDPWFN